MTQFKVGDVVEFIGPEALNLAIAIGWTGVIKDIKYIHSTEILVKIEWEKKGNNKPIGFFGVFPASYWTYKLESLKVISIDENNYQIESLLLASGERTKVDFPTFIKMTALKIELCDLNIKMPSKYILNELLNRYPWPETEIEKAIEHLKNKTIE